MGKNYYITVSETRRGTPWDRTLIETIDFKSDDPYKDAAEIICKYANEKSWDYPDGLYFRIGEENSSSTFNLLSVNTQDKYTSEKSSFMRHAGGGISGVGIDYNEKKKYLVCLDEQTNDYKSYTMYQEANNDMFGVSYGRIGGVSSFQPNYDFDKEGAHFYPAQMFWFKYYEKINKDYIDRSEIKDFEFIRNGNVVSSDTQNQNKTSEAAAYKPIEEEDTRELIEYLINKQRDFVKKNYDYNPSGTELNTAFNQKAIDMANGLLDKMRGLAAELKPGVTNSDMEAKIIKVYKDLMLTLPRRVKDVSQYIHRIDFADKTSPDYIDAILEEEQDLLDNLEDVCVADKIIEKENTVSINQQTILEKNGLTARTATFEEKFDVLEKMTTISYKASRVLAVNNSRTTSAYEACKKEMKIHNGGCHLLWHGSRTENWWSIFKNGMSLNPNAVKTGSMFGQGLYFAPKAEKSSGYTDNLNSYWAHGTSTKGYLALYEVAMGKPYKVDAALGGSFSGKDLRYGCHSVWAKAGNHLRNDECIVYREDQCNIKFLVELDSTRTQSFTFDIAQARHLKFNNVAYENGIITADIPNFKTQTGISTRGASASYDIDNDLFSVHPTSLESKLNNVDIGFIKEIFMSKFAKDKYEFKEVAEEIKAYDKIPADILDKIEDKTKKSINNGKDKD